MHKQVSEAPSSATVSSTSTAATAKPAQRQSGGAQQWTAPPGRRRRADSKSSVATFHQGGAESIFRLLPRESRPALQRMMHIEPSARCTLTDLLHGKGKSNDLLCGCHSHAKDGSWCEDHDHLPEDEDDGDAWLKSIVPCSKPGVKPNHTHIKVAVDEKSNGRKKPFF
ncbi:uncharacterized protein LAESUDRAFT_691832 [Laetiporus sulphureus 93-53]|uniref:Uncharacterized protein n=1 Tax=Laetiporus sulphureus 93-53 TaxID=1314785 RepID=A0A165H4C9_9APHY|nr:uncharacterized protein LAESUDRAFT_691832 [Laetiporus sulphureus 93-53]KZT11226.1 hypothetical protein LAESUDRAFT_691832 [Laetiporus sulphureus 93-53]